jgi:hypothetical protein
MNRLVVILVISSVFLIFGCVSTGTQTTSDKQTNTGTQDSAGIIARMKDYLASGKEKIEYGSVSEGIKQLVSVLAEKASLASPGETVNSLAKEAEVELTKIKASLSMEVEPTLWVDKSMNQLSGHTIDLTPQPSIILTIDTGLGRSLVANAPILFKFIKGNGILSGIVNTNDYGQANCKIVRFDNPKEESIIRAGLIYKEKGFSYEFEGLLRDFVYLPPTRKATIFVLEKSDTGLASDPRLSDVVFNGVKDIDFEFTMYNGNLAGENFMKIFSGDKSAIGKLGLEEGVSYLFVVFADCNRVSQQEFEGKKLKLYMSEGNATARVIRAADGKVMYDKKIAFDHAHSTHGQGGSAETAIRNFMDLAAAGMAELLKKDKADIDNALTGKEK